jgi:oligoendopeptidase F
MSDNGNGTGPWRLDDLFAGVDVPAVEAAVQTLQQSVEAFAARRDQLSPDMDASLFRETIDSYEEIVRQASRLLGYASLSFAADTQNQRVLNFMARMQQLGAELENRSMFFQLWWKDLDDEAAAGLLKASGPYRYWLERLRLQKPHTLSEAEERIVNLKDVNGVNALNTLYDAITNRYTFKLTVDGEEKELTRGELTVYYRHPDPEMRAAAFQELFRVYGQDALILGQIYQAIVRDWSSEKLQLRHYETAIAARNLDNHIPDDVVNTLLDVARENAAIFQRYFQLKARWLGMEKLRRYDVYAPVGETDKEYSFGDGATVVLESYRQFEPEIAELARRVLDEQHLDSEVRPGKRGGAFCATITPDLTPWILQSYQGRLEDVATLAHELGHAVHSMLSAHHTALTQHASLPLAETASTFGEMLLVDRLLADGPDPAVEQALLFRQMDDAYATIMRQSYFAIFERTAHDLITAGGSVDDISEKYLENLKEQFGDAVDLSDDFCYEWLAIPHFYHSPFYVYAYAFGQLLVLALYQQYREEGESFKPRYRAILAAGGSDAPERVLEQAGINIRDAAFWQGGFDVLAGLLERLESFPAPQAV